mmetsp:Transcript_3845/g.8236  ORF Transcript_3845/g.8236 Transcript_3845/m.8236 type:complete len:204 (+) Transcript_3845:260-871(+)
MDTDGGGAGRACQQGQAGRDREQVAKAASSAPLLSSPDRGPQHARHHARPHARHHPGRCTYPTNLINRSFSQGWTAHHPRGCRGVSWQVAGGWIRAAVADSASGAAAPPLPLLHAAVPAHRCPGSQPGSEAAGGGNKAAGGSRAAGSAMGPALPLAACGRVKHPSSTAVPRCRLRGSSAAGPAMEQAGSHEEAAAEAGQSGQQ